MEVNPKKVTNYMDISFQTSSKKVVRDPYNPIWMSVLILS